MGRNKNKSNYPRTQLSSPPASRTRIGMERRTQTAAVTTNPPDARDTGRSLSAATNNAENVTTRTQGSNTNPRTSPLERHSPVVRAQAVNTPARTGGVEETKEPSVVHASPTQPDPGEPSPAHINDPPTVTRRTSPRLSNSPTEFGPKELNKMVRPRGCGGYPKRGGTDEEDAQEPEEGEPEEDEPEEDEEEEEESEDLDDEDDDPEEPPMQPTPKAPPRPRTDPPDPSDGDNNPSDASDKKKRKKKKSKKRKVKSKPRRRK